MIVVDTSALSAVLFGESDAGPFSDLLAHETVVVGAPTRLEFLMVAAGRLGEPGLDMARRILEASRCSTMPWNEELVEIAANAFLRFGKGRQNPAKLNFGDCMAYALAKSLDAPLLFKGDDFSRTDVRPALADQK